MRERPSKKTSPWLIGCLGVIAVVMLIGGAIFAVDIFSNRAQSPASTPPTPTYTPPTSTPPVNTSPSKTPEFTSEILITVNNVKVATEVSGTFTSKPKSGNMYLVISLTIANNGYDKVSSHRNYFNVTINNVKYDPSYLLGASSSIEPKDVLNRESVSGDIYFEIPSSAANSSYILGRTPYSWEQNYNIKFVNNFKTIPTPTPTPTPTAIVEVTAVKLYTDYAYGNSLAADAKYKDKTVKVTGIVTMIGKELLGRPYVLLAGGGMYIGVQCVFNYGYETELVALKIGNRITVQGICEGYLGDVQVHNCVLVP